MNRNNEIKVIEAILGLMNLVLLMLFFCYLYEVGPKVDRTMCTDKEGHNGRIGIVVYKKSICCSYRRTSVSLGNQLTGIFYICLIR